MSSEPLELLKVDYRELYKTGKTLGQGAFGKVKLATRKADGTDVAVKLVNTNEWSERERRQFENEICTLYELQVG
jgi:serine/threonine protein kinase